MKNKNEEKPNTNFTGSACINTLKLVSGGSPVPRTAVQKKRGLHENLCTSDEHNDIISQKQYKVKLKFFFLEKQENILAEFCQQKKQHRWAVLFF